MPAAERDRLKSGFRLAGGRQIEGGEGRRGDSVRSINLGPWCIGAALHSSAPARRFFGALLQSDGLGMTFCSILTHK